MKIEITVTKEVEVKYLKAEAGVRYWEDTEVNGIEDEEGDLIPFREGDYWCPIIEIETGKIFNWPSDKIAKVHYKVCDNGNYYLLDSEMNTVKSISGYVPDIMSPAEPGYGDYIIMNIDNEGQIANWKVTLSEFQGYDNY